MEHDTTNNLSQKNNDDYNKYTVNKTHESTNYGTTVTVLRPNMPHLKTSSILAELSVKATREFSWTTDCLAFELSFDKYLNSNDDSGENLFKYTHSTGPEFRDRSTDKIDDCDDISVLATRFSEENFSTVFKAKYFTWYRRDKYSQKLFNYFTISITDKILIEFDKTLIDCDDNKITLSRDWLFKSQTMPEKPQELKSLRMIDNNFYFYMDLGRIIYETLCQIFKNRVFFDL